MAELDNLLYLAGISADYLDYHGNMRAIPHEDRLQALREMGFDPDDPAAVSRAVYELDAAPWECWLRPFYIVDEHRPVIQLHCHPRRCNQKLFWEVDTEFGTQVVGSCIPAELPETGEYYLGDTRYSAHALGLNELAPGYHQLRISDGSRQAALLSGHSGRWRPTAVGCELPALHLALTTQLGSRRFWRPAATGRTGRRPGG